jgi:hypothetical protein
MENLHGSKGSANLNFGRAEWLQSGLTLGNAQASVGLTGIEQRTLIRGAGVRGAACKGTLASRLKYPVY